MRLVVLILAASVVGALAQVDRGGNTYVIVNGSSQQFQFSGNGLGPGTYYIQGADAIKVSNVITGYTWSGSGVMNTTVVWNGTNATFGGLTKSNNIWSGLSGVNRTALDYAFRIRATNTTTNDWAYNSTFNTNSSYTGSFAFGPEWAGKTIQIKDQALNVIGTYVVPAGGGTMNINGVGNGAQLVSVWADGNRIDTITATGQGSGYNIGNVESGPGLSFTNALDFTYQGNWQMVNNQGNVIASGTVPTGGGMISGVAPLLPGQTATFQVQQNSAAPWQTLGSPMSPGTSSGVWVNNPSFLPYTGFQEVNGVYTNARPSNLVTAPTGTTNPVWPPTNVVVPSNGVTFTNPVTNLPSTNVTTNTATTTTSSSNGVSVSTNVTVSSNTESMVSVSVSNVPVMTNDYGQAASISNVSGLLPRIKTGYSDMLGGNTNMSKIWGTILGIGPDGTGSTCTFQLGPYTINLSGFSGLRTGISYLVMLMSFGGIIDALRRLVD